mmetsp:Transcript_31071/g.100356  ORF Transcript_31071/g.100356 Transcript_31071/m.100356 type:complete len:261 (-) Transcript_31071:317-1099(-)
MVRQRGHCTLGRRIRLRRRAGGVRLRLGHRRLGQKLRELPRPHLKLQLQIGRPQRRRRSAGQLGLQLFQAGTLPRHHLCELPLEIAVSVPLVDGGLAGGGQFDERLAVPGDGGSVNMQQHHLRLVGRLCGKHVEERAQLLPPQAMGEGQRQPRHRAEAGEEVVVSGGSGDVNHLKRPMPVLASHDAVRLLQPPQQRVVLAHPLEIDRHRLVLERLHGQLPPPVRHKRRAERLPDETCDALWPGLEALVTGHQPAPRALSP